MATEAYDAEQLPLVVASVLQEYNDVFSERVTLPPRRLEDQKIPLIPGAQPVSAHL